MYHLGMFDAIEEERLISQEEEENSIKSSAS